MQLNSSGAWNEAVATVKANRDIMLAIAGVFFLLPGLASVLLFADLQEQLFAMMRNRSQAEKFVQSGALNPVIAYSLFAYVLQTVGNLALLSILTDRTRPTVAETLQQAVKALPSAIGTTLLTVLGVFFASLIFSLLAAVVGKVAGPLTIVLFGVFMGILIAAFTRLSLALPVIVADKLRNPLAVLRRSFDLTRGCSSQLLLFYVVLFVVYAVILVLVGAIAGVLAAVIAGEGKGALLLSGLLTGVIGAAAGVLFTAVLAVVHRQLAGPSSSMLKSTFD
jgi:uncharacterized membrane protein YeaQ/YmgE (transglycosylase-associated protein family)